ncbi:MAG TPA: SAM-dependent methyltransferase [Opitutaceae bacterium]|nr:SAM-dependent methyltransferase [Opitutaceae bacterium]
MGSSLETSRRVDPDFAVAFAARAGAGGAIPFAAFVELALYHPVVGYYRRRQTRVGYGAGTDFFTATTSGPVFGELVCAACVKLLRGRNPAEHRFVEIGAEPGAGIVQGVAHPFASAHSIGIGEPIELTGPCIVFSNELFDARPFRRFRFRSGAWRELGVRLREDSLEEIELPLAPASGPPAPYLPAETAEGYVIDAPEEAADLAASIARQAWSGLFVACDYGKSWQEIVEALPFGTARAYFRHSQGNDLLTRPGQQDLTCHVCWDWLADALTRHGFEAPQIERQESFFIHHAEAYLSGAIAADAAQFTRRKQSLFQLLHGAHLGQKFQVLHALR